jgi:hypothetical protein
MLSTVKPDNNSFIEGHEINNVCFNRLLPTKLDPCKLTVSQILPEQTFCIRAVVA